MILDSDVMFYDGVQFEVDEDTIYTTDGESILISELNENLIQHYNKEEIELDYCLVHYLKTLKKVQKNIEHIHNRKKTLVFALEEELILSSEQYDELYKMYFIVDNFYKLSLWELSIV